MAFTREQSVMATFEIFKPKEKDVVEIRSIKGYTYSGYYKDRDKLLCDLKKNDDKTWYFVFNTINDACYSREQCECIMSNKALKTTSDNDIKWLSWLLIDCDPVRISGVSATNEEKQKALEKSRAVYKFLRRTGFSEPVVCDSGNGYHLMYKISVENEKSNVEMIKKFLQTLDVLFSDENVSIDTAVFNPARITKVYGTMATKGHSTEERPHRASGIIKVPDEIKPTSYTLIQSVCKILPEPEKPSYKNNYQEFARFDIDNFLMETGIGVYKDTISNGVRKIILERCPFDSSHKAPDSAIFVLGNGAIAFKCYHNSCSQYTWKDLRKKFDPSCYEFKKDTYQTRNEVRTYEKPKKLKSTVPEETKVENAKPIFLKLSDIETLDRSKIVSIKTGINYLDKKIIGMNKGEMSIWSGGNGCVDCDTEFFNGTGWKKISEYEYGEMVLQYNTDGTASLVKPINYYCLDEEILYQFKNLTGSFNQCVSSEHNLVYLTKDDKIKKRNTMDFIDMLGDSKRFSGWIIPFFNFCGSGVDISDSVLRLMVAICADGNFPKKCKNNYCRICLKKSRKKKRLEMLLKDCGIEYSKDRQHPNDLEAETYTFYAPYKFKEFPKEWYNFNKFQAMVFLDEVFLWDGNISKTHVHKFFSNSKASADFVQFISSSLGRRCSLKEDVRDYKATNYSVCCCNGSHNITLNCKNGINIEKVKTKDGKKYCFEVPSGMLVLRKNNAINVTGNSGKSTVLSQIALEAVDRGFSSVIFSGELTGNRMKNWLCLQAAGRQNTVQSDNMVSYFTPRNTVKKIEEWTNEKLYIYNNDYGIKVNDFIRDLKKHLQSHKTDVVIVDNLMSLDLSQIGGEKYDRQTQLVLLLSKLCKETNTHIHFVCHPKKAIGFLRKDDISGTADITNAADNVFMVHRVNNDFIKKGGEFIGKDKISRMENYSNVIEIMKNRDIGISDVFIGMYFEPESKRMLNEKYENKVYGWEDREEYKTFLEDVEDLPFD